MAWLEGWSNRLEFTIDSDRVDEDLTDFPVLIALASGSGRNNFDAGVVFDELIHTSGNGTIFEDDFSDGNDYGWEHTSTVGSIVVDPAGYLRLNDDGVVTTSGTYSVEDWEISFRMYQGSTDGGNSYCKFFWNQNNSGDDEFSIDLQRYSSINRSRFYYKVGGSVTTIYNSNKYNYYTSPGWFSYRVRKIGNIFYLKHWYQGELEPPSWDYVGEHVASFSNQGQLQFVSTNSNSAGIDDILMRDINIQGYDEKIAVTDYTGINQLYTEIENFNFIDRIANLWTKVPTIASGTDTTLYLYYDSSQLDNNLWIGDTGTAPALAVWDDDYYGVWHLAGSPDNTASSLKDSTDTGNHGTSVNMDGLVDSILDDKFIGINTDGSNEYAQCGNDSTLQLTSNFSVECVAKTTDLTSDALVAKTDSGNTQGWGLKLRNTTNVYLGFKISNSHYTALEGNTTFNTSDYYYFGFSYVGDGSNPTVVVNDWLENMGVVSSAGSGGLNGFTDSGQNFEIGAGNIFSSSQTYHTGPITEVRYSNTVRSTAWLKATYYTSFDNLMTVALGGTAPPPSPPEPPWQDDWANFYEIDIDASKVDENLAYFPVLVTLGSGVGITNFDSTGIFDHLETGAGADSYTSFLLPTDGDLSDSKHDNIAFAYDPTITTVSGVSCVSLNGTNQCVIVVEDSSDWDMGLEDFTMEASLNADNLSSPYRIMAHGAVEDNNGSWAWGFGYHAGWGTGVRLVLDYRYSGSIYTLVSDELTSYTSASTWHDVAITRSGSTLYFFLDGILRGTASITHDLTSTGATGEEVNLFLAARRNASTRAEFFPGYMTQWAIHKGEAKWTSDYTPTTFPVKAQYTKFLYNALGDGSQYQHNLNMVSDPEVHKSDPARGTSGYWYFDGGGTPEEDHIEVPSHSSLEFGSFDFTVEFWFKTVSVSATSYILGKRFGTSFAGIVLAHSLTGNIVTFIANAAGTAWQLTHDDGCYAPVGEWIHYALTRDGNIISIYLDGVMVHTAVITQAINDDGGPLCIGARGSSGADSYYGYLQGVHISKGIARYTTNNFVPPNPPDGTSWFNRKKIQLADVDHNRLYTEIERWDHDNKQAWLWTKAPVVLSGTDTKLYLYYDNAQQDNTIYVGDTSDPAANEVWTDDYSAVWHMAVHQYISSTDALVDSSGNDNDLTTVSFSNTVIYQMMDGANTPALNFFGSNYLTKADNPTLDLTTNYTLEVMFRPTSDDLVDQLISKASSDSNGYQIRGDNGSGPNFNTGTGSATGRAGWQTYGWQYAAGVCTTASAILYIEGDKYDENPSTGTPANSSTFIIGRRWDSYPFNGQISEVRVSDTPRSAAYVKTNKYNLWDDLLSWTEGVRPVYTASGTTTVDSLFTGGIPVRLYRRSTGELVGSTLSEVDGTFTIDSVYNEEHYITALYTASGTNALVYDWIAP